MEVYIYGKLNVDEFWIWTKGGGLGRIFLCINCEGKIVPSA